MKYTLIIDKEKEDEIIVYARERSELIEKIEELLEGGESAVTAYRGEEIIKLSPKDADCFFTDGGRVCLRLGDEKYSVKERLCKIEEMTGTEFVKINQGCIVKIKSVKRFESTVGGALKVVLKNGFSDYISRREMKKVKERFGL